jgi:hypothetical protein
MAIVTLNPLIISMSGRCGSFVFYRRHGKNCIRIHVIPRNPDTERQRTVRYAFAEAVKTWQSMNRDEKEKYIIRAHSLPMSGYNLFISEYMKKPVSGDMKPVPAQTSFPEYIKPAGNTLRLPSVSYPYTVLSANSIANKAGINAFNRLQFSFG